MKVVPDMIVVEIENSKTKVPWSFVIPKEFCSYVQKYIDLREPKMLTARFFINYQRGKCSNQVIGKNKFSKMPCEIAEFLGLPEPARYTGSVVIRCRKHFIVSLVPIYLYSFLNDTHSIEQELPF